MSTANPSTQLSTVAALQKALADRGRSAVPLLVVRLPVLERTAWREGLRKARTLERRACAAFSAAASRVLRADDRIAHDPGSDVFVAALTAPTRDAVSAEISVDARSALARMSASMESATRLDVESGWTTHAAHESEAFGLCIERALARGAQERERYAFFSALGHELRTPLASIRGYLETLLDDGVDEATRGRFLSIAYKESLRLSRLIEGMFEISLLDLQTARTTRSCGTLDVALDAAADACAANAAARSMTLLRTPTPCERVAIDDDRLTLVLINVIDNAIKHGRPGGTVALWAEVADTSNACVTVDDDGPGIAASDRERVFAIGERGPTAAQGTGIGLALVRLMLERVGGRVEVTDSPFGGARFRIHLPREPALTV